MAYFGPAMNVWMYPKERYICTFYDFYVHLVCYDNAVDFYRYLGWLKRLIHRHSSPEAALIRTYARCIRGSYMTGDMIEHLKSVIGARREGKSLLKELFDLHTSTHTSTCPPGSR